MSIIHICIHFAIDTKELNMSKSLHIGVVGLGFGAEFVPIYKHHPNVRKVTICDKSQARIEDVISKFGDLPAVNDFDGLLNDTDIDAVHLITAIPDHARQSVAVLNSGKHCACTVPMATTIEDVKAIVEAVRKNDKKYSMMETQIYNRVTLWVKALAKSGAFGEIQMVRGAHYQDMENWPSYWAGLPPMWYGTHAISPILDIAGCRAASVHCFGSGYMREELQKHYGNPFPVETAIFRMENGRAAEATRALFQCARAYSESYNIYGEDACFEWQQIESQRPVLFRLEPLGSEKPRDTSVELIDIPDYAHLLPQEIRRFTTSGVYDESNPHKSFIHGGGHGGSHPHMVNEFIGSIVENRKPYVDEIRAADWTAAGICAHESAMRGGELVEIPFFGKYSG